ncbi:MAG TPA: serine hydrolase domain-containing protein [Thermomicrobiales bacterium]|nr:serine hydrolase domain-containing protein [Thermomicrobiales bacterium]
MTDSQTPLLWPTADALEAAVQAFMDDTGFPGAITLVAMPESETWIGAFGIADREAGTPMRTDMRLRVGSVTKTFTATVVLQLVDEGRLSLDDTLQTLLPDAPDLPHAEAITLRQILNMRSGVFNYTEHPGLFGTVPGNEDRVWSPAELVDIARQHDAYFEPGTDFHYSNTNYILLEMIVERATGNAFGDELRRRVLDPLGLTATTLPTTPDMPEPFAHGYGGDPALMNPERDPDAKVVEAAAEPEAEATPATPPKIDLAALRDSTRFPPSLAAGAGAIVSTVDDLDRWIDALLEGWSLKPETQAARMAMEPTPANEAESAGGYGLGIMRQEGVTGHGGGILGYTCYAGRHDASGTNVVILTNGEGNGTEDGSVVGLLRAVVRLLPGGDDPSDA